MTAGKREIEQRLTKLEKVRHCSACAPGADTDGDTDDSDRDAASTVAGDWVAERLVVQADGEPEPSVGGCCPRCGREPRVMIVRERVVALASGAPAKPTGNEKKPASRPSSKATGKRRTR